jgi:hypothetical protein
MCNDASILLIAHPNLLTAMLYACFVSNILMIRANLQIRDHREREEEQASWPPGRR